MKNIFKREISYIFNNSLTLLLILLLARVSETESDLGFLNFLKITANSLLNFLYDTQWGEKNTTILGCCPSCNGESFPAALIMIEESIPVL